jgi:hypothetical protein
MALDIKREMAAVDNRDYNFYDKLTDEEKKSLTPYVLMRYTSNVDSNNYELQEWFLEMTNEMVNKNHWTLSKNHKPLLWKLMAGVGIGSKYYHPYLAAGKKEKTLKIAKLIADLNPAMKLQEVNMLAKMMNKEDIKKLFDDLGFDKKQRKEYE